MRTANAKALLSIVTAALLTACASSAPPIPVDTRSTQPGQTVTRGGSTTLNLLGTPLRVGDPLPEVTVIDTHLKRVELGKLRGQVLLLSIVPSLDTRVCERQTHLLGEEGDQLPPGVRLITISRDLPFAQQRFAEETGFKDILFLSDYQQSAFGLGTGLLVDHVFLLARSVVIADRQGIVRYIQVVPELSHLPDMQAAFAEAARLANQP